LYTPDGITANDPSGDQDKRRKKLGNVSSWNKYTRFVPLGSPLLDPTTLLQMESAQ
jgi:hypothetical protein